MRAAADPRTAWLRWRETRDELFRSHPQSPLPPDARAGFRGLDYHPYDPAFRVAAELLPPPAGAAPVAVAASTGPALRTRPFALASFALGGRPVELEVHWLEAYAGGAFLAFRDATSGATSYGGGRYVLDTVKGADLGAEDGRLIVDFNFAYHPSCAYDPRWACPLAPPANAVPFPVTAGERIAS